ncbi:hypothetical protein Aph01nite_11030 [Acrocarpospora phusangensis]|uniref:Beta/gamma crystallin 'Greek key' domain-containing protein n=1 Tax=Acrocarpospora phusangensis TaxID=1070424 RepID=A0A919Q6F9_9ACTN|nr:hypothetical protein [Acrocarpospora phusangensis]GIH22793.1 hypothetical protein Aph01nite_11030 [Acrocarpospora phusangensis]
MRSIKALSCAVLAAALGLGPASPAQATTRAYAADSLKLYDDAFYEGYWRLFPHTNHYFDYEDNDEASSVENNTPSAWVLFDDVGFKDRRFCIRPGEKVVHLGAPAYKFNDKVSSVLRLGSPSCGDYPTFFSGD